MGRRTDVLDAITTAYLNSRDFNGLPIDEIASHINLPVQVTRTTVAGLIRDGLASAVFGDEHPNPFVHAFPDKSRAQQVRQVKAGQSCCVYPATKHLREVVNAAEYSDRPFTLRLKLGEPELTPISADLAVLEFYRNDPRYYYTHGDIWGTICIADEYYESQDVE